jgi:uncharacterized protein (DUF927 family)
MLASENRHDIRRTFEALHGANPRFHAELRVLGMGGPQSGVFTDPASFAEAAIKIDSFDNAHLYVTLNPVNFRSGMNQGVVRAVAKGGVSGDADIESLRWMLIDFDPVRPSNVCATHAEKAAAKAKMEDCRGYLLGLDWPEPVVADSGNGYHLLYPIELPNHKAARNVIKHILKRLSQRFSDSLVKIDESVFNPARITRLYGTVNRKGENLAERPWRRSALLSCPESRRPMTKTELERFDSDNGLGQQETELASIRQNALQANPRGGSDRDGFDMEAFLAAAEILYGSVEDYHGGRRWVLTECPFNPAHNRGEVAFFVDEHGAPGFNCFHDSCSQYSGWQAFLQEFRDRHRGDPAVLEAIDQLPQQIGYFNTGTGLFFGAQGKPAMRLGDPLRIVARVRNEDSLRWGVALRWNDPDGNEKDLVISSGELINDSKAILAILADQGYRPAIHSRAKEHLTTYLLNHRAPSAIRADNPGWLRDAYVLPDEVMGSAGEDLYYVRGGRAVAALVTSGDINDWRTQIGRLCVGNSRLLLAASMAFAGPLLRPTNNETGGIHLRGGTSIGKTTALQVAGSVCGGGGVAGYIRQWRATTNGLEGVAAAHNDGLLVLDELGQISGRELADAIYMLANQSGKSRATKDGGLAPTRTWRNMILSSGEISPAVHAKEAGRQVRGGVEVRLPTVPADAENGLGLFENLHEFASAAALANHLKEQTKAFYGTPLREFLRWLCSNLPESLRILEQWQEVFEELHGLDNESGEVVRVRRRFALIAAAGELASHAGVTGWSSGAAMGASGKCLQAWLGERGGAGCADIDKGVDQVRSILETQASRFQEWGNPFVPPNRIGFVRPHGITPGEGTSPENLKFNPQALKDVTGVSPNADNEALYLILVNVFRDVMCAGYDHKLIRDALIERGMMEPGDKTRRGQRQLRIPDLGKQWVYVMRGARS